MRLNLIFAAMLACLVPAGAALASDYLIDQRDPKYQVSIDHLSNAARALSIAQAELKLAEANHPLPGLDLVRMLGQIEPVEQTINVILAPERKRYQYQTITPDGLFFTPTKIGNR